jgi:hypothetical protein
VVALLSSHADDRDILDLEERGTPKSPLMAFRTDLGQMSEDRFLLRGRHGVHGVHLGLEISVDVGILMI